jgi:hypothetical protein
MWIMLLGAGISPAARVSSTRVGVIYRPTTGARISSSRTAIVFKPSPSAKISSTRVGIIYREKKE